MIRRQPSTAPKVVSARSSVRARKLAEAGRFWVDLATRLDQARLSGIPLEKVTQERTGGRRKRQSPRRG